MPLDPESLRAGKEGTQVNARISNEAAAVVEYLRFVTGYQSRGAWLVDIVGAAIEAEEPHIRAVLEKPGFAANEHFNGVLEALNQVCPPEEQAPAQSPDTE